MTSEVTARANAFVEQHQPRARDLGAALAELTEDPESFARSLTDGLRELEDPAYNAEQERVAPGSGATLGVRWPLFRAVERPVRAALAEGSSASALWLAQRLASSPYREVRLFALPALRRSIGDDPERSWQLLRRMARGAADWISVDSLADVFALGILAEPFRWAEIEQLVYSPQRMERRLVGSTLATLPHRLPHGSARSEAIEHWAPRCLDLERQLMGDADDQVRKALGWAIREWSKVAPAVTQAFLRAETDICVANRDGNRAWSHGAWSCRGEACSGADGQSNSCIDGTVHHRRPPGTGQSRRQFHFYQCSTRVLHRHHDSQPERFPADRLTSGEAGHR